jgi:phosphonate utilization transcriptional regulator
VNVPHGFVNRTDARATAHRNAAHAPLRGCALAHSSPARIVDNLQPTSFNGNMLKSHLAQAARRRAPVDGEASSARTPARDAGAIVAPPRASVRNQAAANAGTIAQRAVPRAVADDHPIALIQSHSLPALVQRELARMILAGDLPAGAKLREVEVASMLGVSRGPVREAFRALEESGLVRLEKNRGVFVRQIGLDEVDQIFELRAVLDEFAGRRAAQRATPEQTAELRALVDRMEQAATRGDVDGYHDANVAFHDRIVELAGNAKLTFLYRRLVNELHLHRRASLGQQGILPLSMREHRAIVDHIASGHAAAAGRALHDHAAASRERVHHATEVPVPKGRKSVR